MEIRPEDYLDLSGYDMHRPAAVRPLGEPAPAQEQQPQTIDEVAQALHQAERRGDHGAVGLLSAQLDDLLAGTPAEAPVATQEEPKEEVDPETTEEVEEPSESFTESEFNKD